MNLESKYEKGSQNSSLSEGDFPSSLKENYDHAHLNELKDPDPEDGEMDENPLETVEGEEGEGDDEIKKKVKRKKKK